MAFCTPYSRVSRRSHPFFPAVQQELFPVFRLFDELENLSRSAPIRSFQPRFDVREEKDSFHLYGELPGVSQDNINIEFVDQSTLVVRGKTVRERQSGTASAVEDAAAQGKALEQQAAADDDAAETASVSSGISSNYHQPTVEDDIDAAEASTTGAPTPATTVAETAKPAEVEQQKQASKPAAQDDSHYWVSECSVGQFSRAFNFPGHVDQDAVTASLKNGILSIVVPKMQPKQPRKITVQ